METFAVSSLRQRIIAQFATILLPIVLVLMYTAFAENRQGERLRASVDSTVLAGRAQGYFDTFLDGVIDAVDTGRLSDRALAALDNCLKVLSDLKQRTGNESNFSAIEENTRALHEQIQADASLAALIEQRSLVNHLDQQLHAALEETRVSETNVASAVAESNRRLALLLIAAALISLLSATFFALGMIRGLTRPLERAVSLAGALARGQFNPDQELDTRQDLGGLLSSLDAMRRSLHLAFQRLQHGEARIAYAQKIARLGDWQLELATQTIVWSEEAARIFGRSPAEMPGAPILHAEMVAPDDWPGVQRSLQAAVELGKGFSADFDIQKRDGSRRTVNCLVVVKSDPEGQATHIAGTIQDITERKATEDRIRHLALHDQLTGLPNRQLFDEHVEQSIAISSRNGSLLATMFVDLDRFKLINDSLGHSAGDQLLKETAARMKNCVRSSDAMSRVPDKYQYNVVARQGGDEFAIMLTNLSSSAQAARIAQRLLQDLAQPFVIQHQEVIISASIGISVFPHDGKDATSLLKHADTAMYHAKDHGKNNFKYFLPSMNEAVSNKLLVERELRHALSEDQFILHYQPVFDIKTRRIVGCEALIRWQHPERGLVGPVDFVPIAEECGLIVAIGKWVLRTACRQGAEWQRLLRDQPFSVAVNWANQNFNQPDGIDVVRNALSEAGFDPARLELEMTERSLMENSGNVIELMGRLNALGVRLSIDDFGTGFSSLNYLKQFPIHTIKIDRSFVSEVTVRPEDTAITKAIISIAHALDLALIAEGVETQAQADFLQKSGCSLAQGFLLSPAVAPEKMTRLLVDQLG